MKKRKIPAAPIAIGAAPRTDIYSASEAHPTIDRTELRTYVCAQCDTMQTETVPLRP